ncbi:hypothetical protein K4F52_005182 [Lecanicillium sp. MT-2017a]|nr:hypothetical protein K4F52_005182 [Lecanicillium sp. MT-2017a]
MDLPPAPTPPTSNSMASDRTANLLNLLKFSGGSGSSASTQSQQPAQPQPQQFEREQQPQQQQQQQNQHGQPPQNGIATRLHQPAPSSADPSGLLAALMRGAHDSEENKQSQPPPPAPEPSNPFGNGSPPADTRSYLLNLLNRPKPSQTDQPLLTESSQAKNQSPNSASHTAEAVYGQQHSPYSPGQQRQQSESFDGRQQAAASHAASPYQHHAGQDSQADMPSIYQQLMGSLSQSSPQSQHTQASANAAPAPMQILKRDQGSPAGNNLQGQSQPLSQDRSPHASPRNSIRRGIDRTASYQSHHSQLSAKHASPAAEFANANTPDMAKEPVSAAVNDIASKADREARDALNRAEQENKNNASPIPDMAAAMGKHGPIEPSHPAPQPVETQAEESRKDAEDPKYGLHDAHPAPATSHPVRVVVEDALAVADSWESVDQDEIVVIEEPELPPVKVYNFPMKPWISISLKDDSGELRPQFRDESIMDIARLKKEFDQIDRNLYTASQTYMTYGMSKQGGLRVIRQDDGKDAKVFTDTKDRIFNVGMSVTPTDHEGVHKEAIIGTGISGTVYWVQIKEGNKDHIDDAHLEQYGFALPPVSTQEGDAPGGALKTRARASTIHPEFFAVGRGKCINFIWPSYIMQNNLFKPGHDRVADTERLLKECSLKINTGKAGKDFTFSQDDSVVVSLDKSGRVKFWDVRDLTAVKAGSEGRAPLPAHSSLEVKEPLMTLASTPEGEKAWPTSVLLLDKQRPYQKRCALRYMIVGMKQNHTLQLWDLALGKPVQEFNLPHSNESDAVCSVMYHPSSGMIVIGHPTRNSIYFAHLSAPKYNLKSISQADYIQRLVNQDSSIPPPDSTAVISGVREYSFANRGVLRSLDILCNPAMTQDAEEPSLFELYAMHSKGVACMLIKQHELGWSKDNKVLQAVEAVAEGIATVSKLKTPQPVEASVGENRVSNRAQAKDSNEQTTPAQSEAEQRVQEAATPVKARSENKDVDTPAHSSKENNSEKPEKKSRKKKAAAAKEAESSTNGPSSSPRDAATSKTDASKNGTAGMSSEAVEAAMSGMETRLSTHLSETLKSSLRSLQGKIDEGARVRDESFNHHQLKLLDMVSEVLNENTQKVLESLIHRQFTELVIPAISDKASKSVTELLNNRLQPSVVSAVQKEVQSSIPHAINRSLRSGEFLNSIVDRIGPAVESAVQQEMAATLGQRLSPLLSNVATQSAQCVGAELRQQYQDQFEHFKAQHIADTGKLDQVNAQMARLTDMVSSMASTQAALQEELAKLKQQPVHELPGISGAPSHHTPSHHVPSTVGSHGYGHQSKNNSNMSGQHGGYAPSQGPSHSQPYMGSPQYNRGHQHMRSPHGSGASEHIATANNVNALAGAYANQMNKSEAAADNDLAQRVQIIEQAISEGRLQDAIIQWVQSGKEQEIFRRSLSRYPPGKFVNLPPLMLLVVIATISKDLHPNQRIKEEVEWIEMAVTAFSESLPNHDWEKQGFREVMQSASQTIQLLINRLQPLIAHIMDGYPTDPFLVNLERGKLDWIMRSSERILNSFEAPRHYE